MTTKTDNAVKDAVQNTQGNWSDDIKTPEDIPEAMIAKEDLKLAYKAINEAYDIQWAQGGILDTQAKLTGLQNKVGEKVYAVAKIALAHCKGHLVTARLYFLALCKQAETAAANRYVKEYQDQKPIGQLIPLWATYKSVFSKGMEAGLDPAAKIEGDEQGTPKFATAAQYRSAVQDLREGTGSQAGNTRNANSAVAQLQTVTKDMSPRMQASLAVMMEGLRRLSHEEQDHFADMVLELGQKITQYAETHERKAVAETASEVSEPEVDVGTKAALQAAIDGGTKTQAEAAAHGPAGNKSSKRKGTRAA